MEILVTQDYEFDLKSLIYGKFLQECHESYPEVKITTVTSLHESIMRKNPSNTVISVGVPENVAVVLKLRFGDHLRVRPPVKKDDSMEKFKKLIEDSKKRPITNPWPDPWKDDDEWKKDDLKDKWGRDALEKLKRWNADHRDKISNNDRWYNSSEYHGY